MPRKKDGGSGLAACDACLGLKVGGKMGFLLTGRVSKPYPSS